MNFSEGVLIAAVIAVCALYLWSLYRDEQKKPLRDEDTRELTPCVNCGGEYVLVKVTSMHRRLLRWYECSTCHAEAMRSAPSL